MLSFFCSTLFSRKVCELKRKPGTNFAFLCNVFILTFLQFSLLQFSLLFQGFKAAKLKENLEQNVGQYRIKIGIHQLFCDKVLNLKKGEIGVVVNGRVGIICTPCFR